MMRKDRKYNLIRPFWFEVSKEAFSWIEVMVFGRIISVQVRSSREVASFWPIVRIR